MPRAAGLASENPSGFSRKPANTGSATSTMASASSIAIPVSNIDSPMNWTISWLRCAPTTLRTPTSRARCVDRAVVRFMKLMQAMINTNNAIAENV